MSRCVICGQVDGHVEGCPNAGRQERVNNRNEIICRICEQHVPAGMKVCPGCNTVLEDPVIKGNDVHHDFQSNVQYNSENRPKTEAEDNAEEHCCPVCDYPLREGSDECPNCKNSNSKDKKPEKPGRIITKPGWKGDPPKSHTFSIGLCDENGTISDAKEFTTEDVVIGRDELSPTDEYISSKHIHITNEKGQWYIEDVSTYKQTYLIVKGKTPIENNDVLVLGNKKFRFVVD